MNEEVKLGLVWGGTVVFIALGASLARKLGYMDGDAVTRVVAAANGLMIAWYGNRMPKALVRGAQAPPARRVAAWSLVVSGLIYAVLWAFAPIPVAGVGGCGAVLAGVVVTLSYCLSRRSKAKTA